MTERDQGEGKRAPSCPGASRLAPILILAFPELIRRLVHHSMHTTLCTEINSRDGRSKLHMHNAQGGLYLGGGEGSRLLHVLRQHSSVYSQIPRKGVRNSRKKKADHLPWKHVEKRLFHSMRQEQDAEPPRAVPGTCAGTVMSRLGVQRKTCPSRSCTVYMNP